MVSFGTGEISATSYLAPDGPRTSDVFNLTLFCMFFFFLSKIPPYSSALKIILVDLKRSDESRGHFRGHVTENVCLLFVKACNGHSSSAAVCFKLSLIGWKVWGGGWMEFIRTPMNMQLGHDRLLSIQRFLQTSRKTSESLFVKINLLCCFINGNWPGW